MRNVQSYNFWKLKAYLPECYLKKVIEDLLKCSPFLKLLALRLSWREVSFLKGILFLTLPQPCQTLLTYFHLSLGWEPLKRKFNYVFYEPWWFLMTNMKEYSNHPHVFRKTVLDSTSMTQNLFCGGSSGAELFKFISLVLEKVYQFSFGPCVAFLPRDTHHSELVPPHLWGATHEGIWK